MSSVAAKSAAPRVLSFRPLQLLGLYLVPGLLAALFYAVSGPLLFRAGLPPIWGLLLAVFVVIIPVELGTLLAIGKRQTGCYTLHGVVAIEPLRPRSFLWLVALAILGAFLLPGLVVWLEPAIRATFFSWIPTQFSAGLTNITSYSPFIQWVTLVLWFVSAVMLGPIVEELYFRGFLLPRTANGGRVAPLLNALLFAVYHFWQPYTVLTIFLFVLPLAYIVWWRRNVYLSMVAHCVINGIALIGLLSGIVQR